MMLVGFGLLFGFLIPGSAVQVAVVKRLGRVVKIRTPGTYFDFYMINTYAYFDTTVQKLEMHTESYSSDAQTMDIDMTVQFKIDPLRAADILVEYSTMESLSQRIERVTADNAKSVLSKYTAMKIIETRASISPEVEEVVKETVGKDYYVTVTAVNLTNISFTDEFEKAVEDKVVAEQQKEAAITKAKQELEVAKLTAQAKIEAARGDAESQKIIAGASVEAMALKIVELARSIGFSVEEKYEFSIRTVVNDAETGEILSDVSTDRISQEKPEIGTVVSKDDATVTTVRTSLSNTRYSILCDETHTKDDLRIVIDFVEYLEYLNRWDGELPSVVSGSEGIRYHRSG